MNNNKRETPVTVNYWGTPVADVGDGYCPQCEREGGRHYTICPLRVA